MTIIQYMNRLHYRPRALAPAVEAALANHPGVVLSAARQTGKTTLVQNLSTSSQRSFETLDDLATLDLARKRAEDLLARAPRLTIDEVQRVPDLLLAIKKDVDKRRQRGRFLLTGSANLLLMREVADSLSGRAVYLLLSPFTGGEKRGEGSVPPWDAVLSSKNVGAVMESLVGLQTHSVDWSREILRGGMPRAVLSRSARERDAWFEGLVTTYLERDLRELSQVSSLPDFRRLMGLAAHRVGQLLNQTELARNAGLSQATAHRYLNLLETTFQTHRLAAYSASPAKRLIKSPKLYWRDAGLAAHLAGLQGLRQLRSSRLVGPLLENLVLSALLAWRETTRPKPELYFWRTAGGAEIDFVVESKGQLLPLEVKAASRVRLDDLRHLEIFLSDYARRSPFGAVLYDTDRAHMITRQIIGLPVCEFV